jgi:CSLREA domain-containing protein
MQRSQASAYADPIPCDSLTPKEALMISPRSRRILHGAALLLLCASLLLPTPAYAASFVVNSADDSNDGQCDSNHCSLREAIDAANSNPGPDTISFAGLDATGGDITIHLTSFLNPLLDNGTTIDGTTVQGYINEPVINIVKASGVIEDGIAIQSSDNVVRGLSLAGFGGWPGQPDAKPEDTYGGAIVVTGSSNLIQGNVLGWGAWPNTAGVRLAGGGNSVIGNVISGNNAGIFLQGPAQIIQGNQIGTDAAGASAIPNTYGIYDTPGSGGGHIIGGAGAGEGNLISGNTWDGIQLRSSNNRVEGNLIGTNAAGTAALPNHNGVRLHTATNNLVGDSVPGAGNLISGNARGVYITHGSSQGSLILGNKIGSDAGGTAAIPNHVGVGTMGGADVTIGGLNPGEGNLIFGNNTGFRLENEDNENDYTVIGNTITQNGTGILRIGPNPGAHGFTFSQNSIFDNSTLGIQIYFWEYVVPSLAPPQLTAASKTSISGMACPYCIVEVFVADPDPSGAGEGKTYLTTITADPNGLFTANFAPVGFCQHLTATSTNSQNNTSEFAQNIKGNCILIEPPWLYPLWVFIITVFGALGILIRRRRPDGTRLILPSSLALGALVGAGLIVLVGALPNVIVRFTPEQPVLYRGQLPDCASYLDPSGYAPQDGAALEPTGDVLLEWTPAGDLPDGSLRWTVDLEQVGIDADTRATEDTSLPISAFGMTPTAGSSFEWTLRGERWLPDGETWLPFCSPGDAMTFTIARPSAEEPTPEEPEAAEPTPTVTPTVEPTEPPACTQTLTALMNLTCRSGPLKEYEELGFLLEGETAVPEGQNEDASWFWILNPDWQGHCWVWSGGVEAACMPDRLPLIAYDPLPEPSPACVSTLDRSACNDAGGMWSVDTSTCQCP